MSSQSPTSAQKFPDRQQQIIAEVKHLCAQQNNFKAAEIAALTVAQQPKYFELWFLLTQIYQQNIQFDLMCQSAQKMAEFHLDNSPAQIRKVQCFIYAGEIAKAIASIDKLYQQTSDDHLFLSKLAELYLHTGQHQKVLLCHQKALQLQPTNNQYRYNLAAAHISLGQFEQSRQILLQLIKDCPQDFDAYYMLAGLAKASQDHQHIDLFKKQLEKFDKYPQAEISLKYALGKEYEDIGGNDYYKLAFQQFDQAAKARRQKLSYQVDTDLSAIKSIQQVFSKASNKATESRRESFNRGQTPIFILGLPRSGTTLVESLLSSHEKIASLGEINCFALSLMNQVGYHKNKLDLIEKSAVIDFAELGEKYQYATAGYGLKAPFLIDKTPLNFLYIGLIKQALPQAKIIHLKRHPLDACFAMYKTLFRMGYPFSYDLSDLAQYYAAYQQLMTHWNQLYPNQIFNLNYRDLVHAPEVQVYNLCDYCGVEFYAEILDFYQQKKTVATASAAQVRQPLYKSSVDRWKSYSVELQGLKRQLESLGVDCEG
ncbi:MAG: sulfotransferase [Enterobacterales bacterium]|nr:sulfotransferase [Enterobacterales bacterium]